MNARQLLPTWVLLLLLLVGVVASVVGYIGCFSVVQSVGGTFGPLSWLCLEAVLSLLRIYIWALNPQSDNAPPLELVLQLDEEPPLPTCAKYSDDIEEDNILPLTRANQFLNSITSFAGLVDRFDHPDLTLYYTLTWRRAPISESEAQHERVLYITVFDHKERTTRVYTRDGTADRYYSTASSIPVIDLKHGLLEAQLGAEIDSKNDPIVVDDSIRQLLATHYGSIMNEVHFTTAGNRRLNHTYVIENKWTLKMADTMSARQREKQTNTLIEREAGERPQHSALDGGGLDTSFERDRQYLEQGRIENMLVSLYTTRGKWVEDYMEWVTQDAIEGRALEKEMGGRVDGVDKEKADGKHAVTSGDVRTDEMPVDIERMEHLLIDECRLMELLLAYAVEGWEKQLWERAERYIDSCNTREKEPLRREWRANCWKRLDANIRAMDARMDTAEAKAAERTSENWQYTHDEIRKAWQVVIERFVESAAPSPSLAMPTSRLDQNLQDIADRSTLPWWTHELNAAQERRLERMCEEMTSRLRREQEDVEFWLNQGLQQCNGYGYSSDKTLFECRHSLPNSRSKKLFLYKTHVSAPLEVYFRALKQNKYLLQIFFYDFDSDDEYRLIADTIRDMPWVTSIQVPDRTRLPVIDRTTPLFVYDQRSQDIETFLEEDPKLANSRGTFVFMNLLTTAVSFVGPTFGNLKLRLKHRSARAGTTLAIKGTSFQLTIPSSFTVDDITLRASPSKSDGPSFKSGTRNNVVIQVTIKALQNPYFMHSIQLLDEVENHYDPTCQRSDDIVA